MNLSTTTVRVTAVEERIVLELTEKEAMLLLAIHGSIVPDRLKDSLRAHGLSESQAQEAREVSRNLYEQLHGRFGFIADFVGQL